MYYYLFYTGILEYNMIAISIFVRLVCILLIGYLCMTIWSMKEELMKREKMVKEDKRRLAVLEDLCERDYLEENARKFDLTRHFNENRPF